MEVLLLVLALACRHPTRVFLLRGNHESALMTRTYGFLEECRTRYCTPLYTRALQLFNLLPLAAVISNDIFAVHGGLTPGLRVSDIEAVVRPVLMEAGSLALALTWSDPTLDPSCIRASRQCLLRLFCCLRFVAWMTFWLAVCISSSVHAAPIANRNAGNACLQISCQATEARAICLARRRAATFAPHTASALCCVRTRPPCVAAACISAPAGPSSRARATSRFRTPAARCL